MEKFHIQFPWEHTKLSIFQTLKVSFSRVKGNYCPALLSQPKAFFPTVRIKMLVLCSPDTIKHNWSNQAFFPKLNCHMLTYCESLYFMEEMNAPWIQGKSNMARLPINFQNYKFLKYRSNKTPCRTKRTFWINLPFLILNRISTLLFLVFCNFFKHRETNRSTDDCSNDISKLKKLNLRTILMIFIFFVYRYFKKTFSFHPHLPFFPRFSKKRQWLLKFPPI